MKESLLFLKELYQVQLYFGMRLRKLRKKGADNPKLMEQSLWFFMAFQTVILTIYLMLPLIYNKDQSTNPNNNIKWIAGILGLIKIVFDTYSFFWNDDWIKIVEKFENYQNKKRIKGYLIITILFFTFTFLFMYYRWFW